MSTSLSQPARIDLSLKYTNLTMSNSESASQKIEQLMEINYQTRKNKIKFFLLEKNLWYIVKGADPRPDDTDIAFPSLPNGRKRRKGNEYSGSTYKR